MSSAWVPGFAPTHGVPDGGLDAWVEPDATRAPTARLDAGLDVQLAQWWGDWAKVTCSNGWSAWVDGRHLTARAQPVPPSVPPSAPPPVPPAPVSTPPAPTAATQVKPPPAPVPPQPGPAYPAPPPAYAAPPPTYASPAPYASPAAQPAPAAPVTPLQRAAAGLPPGIDPPALVGAALVLLGSFLPWVSFGPASASAWDISLKFLITGDGALSGFKAGIVLLAVVLVGLPFLTRKPLPSYTTEILGALAAVISVLAWFRINDLGGDQSLGIGLFICLIGGVVMAVGTSVMTAMTSNKR